MTDKPKFQVLVGCQIESCAEETSFHLDMVRVWKDKPICEECYIEATIGTAWEQWSREHGIPRKASCSSDDLTAPDWRDLPIIGLEDLKPPRWPPLSFLVGGGCTIEHLEGIQSGGSRRLRKAKSGNEK